MWIKTQPNLVLFENCDTLMWTGGHTVPWKGLVVHKSWGSRVGGIMEDCDHDSSSWFRRHWEVMGDFWRRLHNDWSRSCLRNITLEGTCRLDLQYKCRTMSCSQMEFTFDYLQLYMIHAVFFSAGGDKYTLILLGLPARKWPKSLSTGTIHFENWWLSSPVLRLPRFGHIWACAL